VRTLWWGLSIAPWAPWRAVARGAAGLTNKSSGVPLLLITVKLGTLFVTVRNNVSQGGRRFETAPQAKPLQFRSSHQIRHGGSMKPAISKLGEILHLLFDSASRRNYYGIRKLEDLTIHSIVKRKANHTMKPPKAQDRWNERLQPRPMNRNETEISKKIPHLPHHPVQVPE